MIPALPLENVVLTQVRPPPWQPHLTKRYTLEMVRSRAAFYCASTEDDTSAWMQWRPDLAGDEVRASATLRCAEGMVVVHVLHVAGGSDAADDLDGVLPELPPLLRWAALEELLTEPLRAWASALRLNLLSIDIDPSPPPLTHALQDALAFFHFSDVMCGISLHGGAYSDAPGVLRAVRAGPSRFPLTNLPWQASVSLRARALHLPLEVIRNLSLGDGLDLGPAGPHGLAIDLCAGRPSRRLARGFLKGHHMTIDTLADEFDADLLTDRASSQPLHSDTHRLASIEALGLRVTVELASIQRSVGELARIRPGKVIDLALPLEHSAVNLLIDEQRIGTGMLVALEDRIAVEITEWSMDRLGDHAT